ncbi:holin [Mycoavidus sp. SF9855]|uniref:holin n=1 Tax=Mycoavidus sp. SF9855 TaxID=2968475 RepID=UPI00211C8B80|nr:holin [Mycoavidus sp. SF9855]UUM22265.1 holin [Mycoavidus sp. SF9855]
MIEPIVNAAVALWLDSEAWLLLLLPSAAGSACSLKCLGEPLHRWQKLYTFLIGVGCAVFIAPALVEILGITGQKTEVCINFLVGLFALAVISQIFKEIQSADFIGTIKRYLLGKP